jgi:hypothetical protein
MMTLLELENIDLRSKFNVRGAGGENQEENHSRSGSSTATIILSHNLTASLTAAVNMSSIPIVRIQSQKPLKCFRPECNVQTFINSATIRYSLDDFFHGQRHMIGCDNAEIGKFSEVL